MDMGAPLGGSPAAATPMRELTDWRGSKSGGLGGESGHVEGEGEMGSGEGRKSAPCWLRACCCCWICCWSCCCCCCCWCIRAMATLVVAAAACRGACTSGAHISWCGCGRGDTAPPPPPVPKPGRTAAVISCMAGMLSCLTICCTSTLSHEPRPARLPAAPPPPPPPRLPPPRPILPAMEPPCDALRNRIEFFFPERGR